MEQQKEQIIEQAFELFLRYGLKSVSMDDVARSLGISKKTVYQHVSTKKELVNLVMAMMSQRDLETVHHSMVESTDAIDEYLRNSRYFINNMRKVSPTTLYDLKKYYPDVWQKQMVEQLDQFQEGILNNIKRGMAEGLFRDDLLPEIIGKLYLQNMIAICDTSMFPGHKVAVAEIIHQHATYHLYGLVNENGRQRLEEHLSKKEL